MSRKTAEWAGGSLNSDILGLAKVGNFKLRGQEGLKAVDGRILYECKSIQCERLEYPVGLPTLKYNVQIRHGLTRTTVHGTPSNRRLAYGHSYVAFAPTVVGGSKSDAQAKSNAIAFLGKTQTKFIFEIPTRVNSAAQRDNLNAQLWLHQMRLLILRLEYA
jgi:hypothetical protein